MTLPHGLPAPDHENTAQLIALHDLYRRHFETLCRFAQERLGLGETAEDVVQEVFLRLFRRAADPTAPVPLTISYFYQSVCNEASHLRRREGTATRCLEAVQYEQRDYARSPDDEFYLLQLTIDLKDAIMVLPARCQEVFRHVHEEGLSRTQTARKMGLSPKTVDEQLRRARHVLRVRLAKYRGGAA